MKKPFAERKAVGHRGVCSGLCGIAIALGLAGAPARGAENRVDLDRGIELLRSGQPEPALEYLERYLDRVGPSAAPGKRNLHSLGSVLLLRAAAEYSLGRRRDARWSWRMALYFDPELATDDLEWLGPAGAFLRAEEFVTPPTEIVRRSEQEECQPIATETILACPEPKDRSRPPRYGEGLRLSRMQSSVVVLTIVREDGTMENPTVLGDPHPGFAYSTLDAMRYWSYQPARGKNGPIPVWHRTQVNYVLR